MKISILTVFPELYDAFLSTSLIARAQEAGVVSLSVHKFSDVCEVRERIDEPTCGPGAGMILKPEVVERALAAIRAQHGDGFVIFFSPQGKKLTQSLIRELVDRVGDEHSDTLVLATGAKKLAQDAHIILVCPRYEGVDERVEEEYADLVISIGDYVLMGGDLPAQVFLEGLLRFVPGVVGNQDSVTADSFMGPFLDYPEFGLPTEWHGKKVPDIVLSGNHGAIRAWRREQAAKKTLLQRFDWLRSCALSSDDLKLVRSLVPHHYVALMHDDVYVKEDQAGFTSVTSIDLHDIARSCATYDVQKFFVVTPLDDQLKIINTFLKFWHSEEGLSYNQSRYQAVQRLTPIRSLDEVVADIEAREGMRPLLVATSARRYEKVRTIDYSSQGEVWQHNKPVLMLFGTGRGLTRECLERCDYLLGPLVGMSDYNHLSVRSAAAIVLDRWLGLAPLEDQR